MNDILSYGNGANFATLVTFGRLSSNTYFHTIVFYSNSVNMNLASITNNNKVNACTAKVYFKQHLARGS